MYFIFHPANDFIYCPPNFPDVIGAFYFSYGLFLAIYCGKLVSFQDRNTNKQVAYLLSW